MLNDETYTLTLPRIAVCDLMLACLAASAASDGAQKWDDLHRELCKQLDRQDFLFFASSAVGNWKEGLLTYDEAKDELFRLSAKVF